MTSFTQDLFISYAHINNQAMMATEKAGFAASAHVGSSLWVSYFEPALPDGEM
jgi:hypothetical protein